MPSAKATRKRRSSQPVQPEPALARSAPPEFFSWQLWIILVLGGMFVVALRTPMDWLHPTFYAEDGMIFYQQQVIQGWHAIFQSYGGYFNLLPRLTAWVLSLAPVRDQPFMFSLSNVVFQSLGASFFFLPENRIFVRSDGLRFLVCLLALADNQGDQMLNSLLAIQWFLFVVAPLMLSHLDSRDMPLSRTKILVYSVLMIAICLTMPLLVFVAPIALYFLVRAPGIEKLIPASMLTALTIQGITFLRTGVAESHAASPPLSLFLAVRPVTGTMGAWIYRDVFTIFLGERAAVFLAARGGLLLAAVTLVIVIVACSHIALGLSRTKRILFIAAIVTSIGLVGTSLVVRRLLDYFGDLKSYTFFFDGARYFFISGWILLVLGAMAVEKVCANWSGSARAALLVALFAMGTVSNFEVRELPDEHWSQYAPAVEQWIVKRDRHEPTPHIQVPIYPPQWAVDLPSYK